MATIADALRDGRRYEQAGDLKRAEAAYLDALRGSPDSIAVLLPLAGVYLNAGRPADAATYLRQVQRLDPRCAQAHTMLGVALAHQRQLAEAIAAFRQAVAVSPDDPQLLSNLGNALRDHGQLPEAVIVLEKALRFDPVNAAALHNLGLARVDQGQLHEAEAAFRRLVNAQPRHALGHASLGMVAAKLGDRAQAAASLRQALALGPDNADVRNTLGVLVGEQGNHHEAIDHFRRALHSRPTYAEAWSNLGNALTTVGRHSEAVEALREALRLAPDSAEAHLNLSTALNELRRSAEALAAARRALDLKPDYAEAINAVGIACTLQGEFDQAVDYYRRALQAKPDYALAHSNLLCTLQYRVGIGPAELAQTHAEFDRQHAQPLARPDQTFANTPDPERPLRLGFVSPDLGQHPVGFFLIGVLEHLDRRQCETTCYSDRRVPDDFTGRLRQAATHWHDVRSLNDDRLAERIRADGIDILFDLAGHTARNRMLVFARKPAPIQITWMGYVGTTGLSAIDYLIADRWEVPVGQEQHYQEKILRLPDDYVCYQPPQSAPAVRAVPATATGRVTFASFNNPAKINPAAVRLWAQILDRVPRSRLVLKYRAFDDPVIRDRYHRLFTDQGAGVRVELLGWSPHPELLETYNRIDIALDTFPYSGGLTTCEALWMGVPVVTWPGETFAGRHSLSHLSTVGLTEPIADSADDYVERAVELANDLPRLAQWRATLRQRMASSPLCDSRRFAANLLGALRSVWQQWCAGAKTG
jgi:predicted O-linked N-acetylglucosamine transferase (SPINDLY family)